MECLGWNSANPQRKSQTSYPLQVCTSPPLPSPQAVFRIYLWGDAESREGLGLQGGDDPQADQWRVIYPQNQESCQRAHRPAAGGGQQPPAGQEAHAWGVSPGPKAGKGPRRAWLLATGL